MPTARISALMLQRETKQAEAEWKTQNASQPNRAAKIAGERNVQDRLGPPTARPKARLEPSTASLRRPGAVGLLSGLCAESMHGKATNRECMLNASGPTPICLQGRASDAHSNSRERGDVWSSFRRQMTDTLSSNKAICHLGKVSQDILIRYLPKPTISRIGGCVGDSFVRVHDLPEGVMQALRGRHSHGEPWGRGWNPGLSNSWRADIAAGWGIRPLRMWLFMLGL